jgi:hypothetical protein
MDKWKVEFKDSKREIQFVEADTLVTADCGAIEFHIEGSRGPTIVDRFEHDEWKQVTKG